MELVRLNRKRASGVPSMWRAYAMIPVWGADTHWKSGMASTLWPTIPDDVKLWWEAIRDNITSAASKYIGYEKRTCRQWFSAEADRLIGLKWEAVIIGDRQERNRYKREFKRIQQLLIGRHITATMRTRPNKPCVNTTWGTSTSYLRR